MLAANTPLFAEQSSMVQSRVFIAGLAEGAEGAARVSFRGPEPAPVFFSERVKKILVPPRRAAEVLQLDPNSDWALGQVFKERPDRLSA